MWQNAAASPKMALSGLMLLHVSGRVNGKGDSELNTNGCKATGRRATLRFESNQWRLQLDRVHLCAEQNLFSRHWH